MFHGPKPPKSGSLPGNACLKARSTGDKATHNLISLRWCVERIIETRAGDEYTGLSLRDTGCILLRSGTIRIFAVVRTQLEEYLFLQIHRNSILAVLGVALWAAIPQTAWAHAILMQSTPAAKSTVAGPQVAIILRYNVRVDGSRSRVHLLAANGTDTNLVLAKQTNPDTLQASATGLKPGAYTLRWEVLASDGHMSRGDVPFTVK